MRRLQTGCDLLPFLTSPSDFSGLMPIIYRKPYDVAIARARLQKRIRVQRGISKPRLISDLPPLFTTQTAQVPGGAVRNRRQHISRPLRKESSLRRYENNSGTGLSKPPYDNTGERTASILILALMWSSHCALAQRYRARWATSWSCSIW